MIIRKNQHEISRLPVPLSVKMCALPSSQSDCLIVLRGMIFPPATLASVVVLSLFSFMIQLLPESHTRSLTAACRFSDPDVKNYDAFFLLAYLLVCNYALTPHACPFSPTSFLYTASAVEK